MRALRHGDPVTLMCVPVRCVSELEEQAEQTWRETKRNETKEGAETGSGKREEALGAMREAYHTITMEEDLRWSLTPL